MPLLPRPEILDIEPYSPGVSKLPGVNRVIKLSSNEGAFGPPPGALHAVAAVSHDLHRYPDGGAVRLREPASAWTPRASSAAPVPMT
jgi:histidinol-phosphate aminotransferase